MSYRRPDCLCVIVVAFLVGCGGGPSDQPVVVPAKGVVNYKGKPMAKLAVAFIPSDKGLLAEGTTDANGRFTLMTKKPGDGAMVGTYNVAVTYVSGEIPEMQGLTGNEKPPESPIPLKYADAKTSLITITVDKDASKNDFTIDLTE